MMMQTTFTIEVQVMKVIIDNGTSTNEYTAIKSLSFAPRVDILGVRSYSDGFEVDIYTEDTIRTGWKATLKDEFGYIYAVFYITSAEIRDEKMVHVIAQSELVKLEKKKLGPRMCENMEAQDLVTYTLSGTGIIAGISSSVAHTAINGYFPAQTARERLTWIAFVLGCCIKTSYGTGLVIERLTDNAVLIPPSKTFWRPDVKYGDYVTAVEITSYSFPDEDPQDGDQTVVDEYGIEHTMRPTVLTVTNAGVPANIPENIVSVSGVSIINAGNASNLLTMMAQYYFDRISVELDVINNKQEYLPGRKYTVQINDNTTATGYCESLNYKIGVQTRTTMVLGSVVMAGAKKLVVIYQSASSPPGTLVLDRKEYVFPAGYEYSVDTIWPDVVISTKRYIFRPDRAKVTGVMGNDRTVVTVNCYPALIVNRKTSILQIISVDGVGEGYVTSEDGNYTIAVIEPSEVD